MVQLDAVRMRQRQSCDELRVTFPHTLQERGPFACPRCGAVIRFVTRDGLVHERPEHNPSTCPRRMDPWSCPCDPHEPVCSWLDEATDEQVEALK